MISRVIGAALVTLLFAFLIYVSFMR